MIVLVGAAILLLAISLLGLWRCRRALIELRADHADLDAGAEERGELIREQAVAAERVRIYSDLHDDIGARLLAMIHAAQTPLQADLARAALQDLRDVVSRSRGTSGTLDETLADIRAETSQRLAAVGITLNWKLPVDVADAPIDPARALHLYRIVREAISNVIRHAEATQVRIRTRIIDARLYLDLTDDGEGARSGDDDIPIAPGIGMRNMRERAAHLAGDIDWKPGTQGGTKVVLTVPLSDAAGADAG